MSVRLGFAFVCLFRFNILCVFFWLFLCCLLFCQYYMPREERLRNDVFCVEWDVKFNLINEVGWQAEGRLHLHRVQLSDECI